MFCNVSELGRQAILGIFKMMKEALNCAGKGVQYTYSIRILHIRIFTI